MNAPVLVRCAIALALWLAAITAGAARDNGCLGCHADSRAGIGHAHAAIADNCTACHAGDREATRKAGAHAGLIAFPGNLDNAARTCGSCHAAQVEAVGHGVMHTGARMVATTRHVFGESVDRPGHQTLAQLTHSPADTLLRKLCASCHLGQNKTAHALDASFDRGGGCLACHINQQNAPQHPALSATVSDARCFGCHSRSGRIALSYAGLAEVATLADGVDGGQLEDGRAVAFRPADRHHAAGMACVDCHTARDVMGMALDSGTPPAARGVDIACDDCHRIGSTITAAQWPALYAPLRKRVPFAIDAETRFPVTAHGTPLWNVELHGANAGDGIRATLHRKDGRGARAIPAYRASDHPLATEHARLDCSACHTQWAPQCYGCHVSFDPDAGQYDHMEGRETPGRWRERSSDIRNAPPPLGVDRDGRVVPVVPGMIMTATHPDWSAPRFVRRFAPLEAHTTGPARACAACHRDSTALGLGQGRLEKVNGQWAFRPTHPMLDDGLPADAWTALGRSADPRADAPVRPFSAAELRRILDAPLENESPRTPD
ncbi:MAG: hypothetical protein PHP86_09715 [Nevskiales bacterium]|nr:hypothetical protein [Nevskiales bacterium]